MDTATLTDLFAHLCGQGRCFLVGGEALPVCQRCAGLCLGAFFTAAWLGLTGLWRRGLPCWSVWAVQVAGLAAAMLGGTHAIDAGPTWRLLCGLATGHVVICWLVGGGRHLLLPAGAGESQRAWSRGDEFLGALSLPVLLAAGAGATWLSVSAPWAWWLITAVIATGGLCLLGAFVLGVGSLLAWTGAGLVKRRRV